MSSAAYQRAWRAKRGARTGKIGAPVRQPCGTRSAYERHRRHGETPCDACRAANTAYYKARREAAKELP